jgi:hypothetical protein
MAYIILCGVVYYENITTRQTSIFSWQPSEREYPEGVSSSIPPPRAVSGDGSLRNQTILPR